MQDIDEPEKSEEGEAATGRSLVLKNDTKKIVVNGREHRVRGDEIGRDELFALAFPGMGAAAAGSALTVAYDNGPADSPAGLVLADRATRVFDGQTFSVSQTVKS